MAAPRKYPDELRERATRMAVELRQDPATKNGAAAAREAGRSPVPELRGRPLRCVRCGRPSACHARPGEITRA